MAYKKAEAHYNAETKTLEIDQPQVEFIPSYAYYVCEYIEQKENVEIEYVQFMNNTSKPYKKEDLKGRYDWSELR